MVHTQRSNANANGDINRDERWADVSNQRDDIL